MKKTDLTALSITMLLLATGCFRQEVQTAEYSIPKMTTPAIGTYLQSRLKTLPGIVESSFDPTTRTLTVKYKSSTIRTMNIEETIALSGFTVNDRPANPKAQAKLPEGIR